MKDFPPTPSLIAMRKKHTRQSVQYNMGHFKDHVKDTHTSIQKLATVDPQGAKQQQGKVAGALQSLLAQTKGMPKSPGLAAYINKKG